MSLAPSLEDVAGAILDGTAVDWPVVESGTAESDQTLLRQLKTLAALRLSAAAPQPKTDAGLSAWGHLRVFERIGHGAFGEVYRAWDTRLDREVALKLLPDDLSGAEASASSVIQEGRLLARVHHPNVATIYGAERIEGRIGLWMEFIKGRTLEQSLKAGATFTPKHATRLGIDLCRAVSAVHSAGLLHRDIKAQNVMVTDEGRLVLMDFGTGHELDQPSGSAIAGTPLYLAPEVLSGSAATARSDVYSVGVLLYRLLTGSYPVQGRTLAELRRAHADRADRDVSVDGVPRRIGRVIARALSANPERRFASADAMGNALVTADALPRRVFFSAAAAAVIASLAATAWQYAAGARSAAATPPAGAAAIADVPGIAVLPFTNLSSEPDSDYFVDGLTSEVIRHLGELGLPVKSKTSSFFFKGKSPDLQTIAEQLKVGLVVEGDMQRVGNHLRVNAQFVSVAGDVPLWSYRFDGPIEDAFKVQDEIARAIVNKLRLSLTRQPRLYQTNVAAYQLYLRARTLVDRAGTDSAKQGAALFQQVIDRDPTFAPAYAGLADAYATMSWQLTGLSADEGLEGMRPAAARALELDRLSAEAHAAMGATYARERQWDAAERSFEQAIDLNPSLSHVVTAYSGSTLIPTQQFEKALQLLAIALVSDPLSLDVKREQAVVQFSAGRYAEAIANLRQVLAVDPEFPFANQMLARALNHSGNPEEAVAVLQKSPGQGWDRWMASAYVKTGRDADMDRLIAAHTNEHPYRQALIYAALGDKDRTFQALDRAVGRVAAPRLATLLVYPEMALLRGDPRLEALRKRLNLR